jgi:hypothetical protein
MQTPSLDGDLVFDRTKIKTIYIEPPKELIFHSFTVADTSMMFATTLEVLPLTGHCKVVSADMVRLS